MELPAVKELFSIGKDFLFSIGKDFLRKNIDREQKLLIPQQRWWCGGKALLANNKHCGTFTIRFATYTKWSYVWNKKVEPSEAIFWTGWSWSVIDNAKQHCCQSRWEKIRKHNGFCSIIQRNQKEIVTICWREKK